MKKLQSIIQEGTQAFDEVLLQLFMSKVQAELTVFQVSRHGSVLTELFVQMMSDVCIQRFSFMGPILTCIKSGKVG